MATRLSILEPDSLRDKLKYQAFKLAFGFFPDVMRVMFASTKLDLAEPFSRVMVAFHRRSPTWTKGETELFASFVSAQNDCSF
ncbi:hypothetical protein [Candidatus Leptofilum sp.]|uniref:hypothetical protein n=1 Tax=Candidatus Leptofilum sp. TaxID=3241576 RepID=UPI003B5A97EC